MLLRTYKVFKFIFRHLIPREFRYPLARAIARFAITFNGARRRVIVANLTPLVGTEQAVRVAPELLGNFLMTAVDFFCERPQIARNITFEGWQRIEEAYEESRRVMIVTAHMGNWEGGIS